MPPSKKDACFWSVLPIDSLFLRLILDTFVKKDEISHGFFLILTHNLEIRPSRRSSGFPGREPPSRSPLLILSLHAGIMSRILQKCDFFQEVLPMDSLHALLTGVTVDGFALWVVLLICVGVFLASFMPAIAGGGGIISLTTYLIAFGGLPA